MVRAQRIQFKLVAAAFAVGSVAMACGGDSGTEDPKGTVGGSDKGDAGTGGGASGGGGGALKIAFNPMYSAFDGKKHEFKVPVKVTGQTGKLTVTTSPADFVDSDPTTDGVMLTTRKAGKAKVIIKDAAGNTGEADLTVTNNAPGDVEIGAQRYANGIDAFTLPEGGIMFPEGGFTLPEGGFPEGGLVLPEGGLGRFDSGITRNDMAACTFCHIPEGASGTTNTQQIDVEHTPQQTAGFSDDELIKVFAEGVKPEGSMWRVVNGGGLLSDAQAARIYIMFHKWNVDEATKKGLVAYLRSLTPKAQGAIDFGGLLRGGGLTRPGATAPAPAMDAGAGTAP